MKPSRPPKRSSPAPAPKSRAKLLAAALVGGGTLLLLIVLALALGGGSKKKPPAPEPPPLAEAPKPPRPAPKPELPPPDPKPVPRPEPKPAPKPEAPTEPDDAFRDRMADRRAKAQARLDEVRREIAEERAAEATTLDAFRRRVAGRPVTLQLRGGEVVGNATVLGQSLYEVQLRAAGAPRTLIWDTVVPASLGPAADVIYDLRSAKDQYDRGRFFVARRMWKEAQDAFERAAKLGEGYETRVSEFRDVLARLVSGQMAFRGNARRIGSDGLLLSYDFSDARQAGDFSPGLVVANAAAVLEGSRAKAGVALRGADEDADARPIFFVDDLSIDLKAAADGPFTLLLFFGPTGGYELELGPAGHVLVALDPDESKKERRRTIAKSDRAKLVPGKLHTVRFQVKGRRFTLSVDRQEALAAEDPPASPDDALLHGFFGFRAAGKLRIEAPLLLQGRLHQEDVEKRLGEIEVLVRRALDPELEEIERRREQELARRFLGAGEGMRLTADDPHFAFRIRKNDDLIRYEALKKALANFMSGQGSTQFTFKGWAEQVKELLDRYPDAPALHYLRALYHEQTQDVAAARSDLAAALRLFPGFAEALVEDARLRLRAQDAPGALRSANLALDAAPDSAPAYVVRALATFTGSPAALESFMEDLELAARLDPYDREAANLKRVLRYQSRGPRELGCRFDHETSHYRVTTDISEEAARRYGEDLEAAWRHFADAFQGRFGLRPLRKPRVAIFNTAENYYTYFELVSEDRGEHTLGVFRQGLNELVLFEGLDLQETRHTLYHEAFHHFMSLMMEEHPPYWYNEGMAEYMGAIRIRDGKVVEKALVLHGRLRGLRWMLEAGATLPFKRIMNETPREFYGPMAPLKYAQAWSMIHFFHEAAGGRHRPLIDRYLASLRAGKPPLEAYEGAFASQVDALEKEWKTFVRTLK